MTLPGHVEEPGYEAELADVAARASAVDTAVPDVALVAYRLALS